MLLPFVARDFGREPAKVRGDAAQAGVVLSGRDVVLSTGILLREVAQVFHLSPRKELPGQESLFEVDPSPFDECLQHLDGSEGCFHQENLHKIPCWFRWLRTFRARFGPVL